MSTQAFRYAVLLGSQRNGRQGSKVAQLAITELRSRGHTVDFIDALEADLPILKAPYHHYGTYIQAEAPAQLQSLAEKLNAADGFVVVDCEYNHTPSPGIINLLDHFYHKQYKFKPAALLTYSMSNAGGARSAFTLRNTVGELGMTSIPSIFSIATVHTAFTEDNTQLNDHDAQVRFINFVHELDWYTGALKVQREQGLPKIEEKRPPAATQPAAAIKNGGS